MEAINSIIAEQLRWLKEKGYTELGLQNGQEEGTFRQLLKMGLQDLERHDGEVLVGQYPFTVTNNALYGQPVQQVSFAFRYCYDAEEQQLTLNAMDAQLKSGVSLSFSIQQYDDLWPPKEVFERLKEMSQVVAVKLEEERTEIIQKAVNDQVKRLQGLGYFTGLSHSETAFANRLLKQINEGRCKENDRLHLHVNTKTKPATGQSVELRFHYQFDWSGLHLRLKFIFAQTKEQKETFVNPFPVIPLKDGVMHLKINRPVQPPLPSLTELLECFRLVKLSPTAMDLMTPAKTTSTSVQQKNKL